MMVPLKVAAHMRETTIPSLSYSEDVATGALSKRSLACRPRAASRMLTLLVSVFKFFQRWPQHLQNSFGE